MAKFLRKWVETTSLGPFDNGCKEHCKQRKQNKNSLGNNSAWCPGDGLDGRSSHGSISYSNDFMPNASWCPTAEPCLSVCLLKGHSLGSYNLCDWPNVEILRKCVTRVTPVLAQLSIEQKLPVPQGSEELVNQESSLNKLHGSLVSPFPSCALWCTRPVICG